VILLPWVNGEFICKPGRPPMGVTKKVSITLPEEVWQYIEEYESKSSFFRHVSLEDYKYAEQVRKSVNG
jgi:hypothetical protein